MQHGQRFILNKSYLNQLNEYSNNLNVNYDIRGLKKISSNKYIRYGLYTDGLIDLTQATYMKFDLPYGCIDLPIECYVDCNGENTDILGLWPNITTGYNTDIFKKRILWKPTDILCESYSIYKLWESSKGIKYIIKEYVTYDQYKGIYLSKPNGNIIWNQKKILSELRIPRANVDTDMTNIFIDRNADILTSKYSEYERNSYGTGSLLSGELKNMQKYVIISRYNDKLGKFEPTKYKHPFKIPHGIVGIDIEPKPDVRLPIKRCDPITLPKGVTDLCTGSDDSFTYKFNCQTDTNLIVPVTVPNNDKPTQKPKQKSQSPKSTDTTTASNTNSNSSTNKSTGSVTNTNTDFNQSSGGGDQPPDKPTNDNDVTDGIVDESDSSSSESDSDISPYDTKIKTSRKRRQLDDDSDIESVDSGAPAAKKQKLSSGKV